jgi:MFS family permease
MNKEQWQAIGLLSFGTFLEYFDLMLYVHMAVLLNELFFPKTDPYTTSLLTALAFCSTYVLRPFGALFFGFIGDYIGRKPVIVLTSIMMALTCLTIVMLPTYDEIGIAASYIMIGCRIVQSMSSMGELLGSEIYLTETIPQKPIQFSIVSIMSICSSLGGFGALCCASLIFSLGLNWRWAFGVGILIALISIKARTKLKESSDKINFQQKLKDKIRINKLTVEEIKKLKDDKHISPKVNWLAIISYGFIEVPYVIFFYFCFIYGAQILKNNFGYTPEKIINHNLFLGLISLSNYCLISYLSYKIYPLILARIRLIIISIFCLFLPFTLDNFSNPFELMLIEGFLVFFIPTAALGSSIIYSYFPPANRFRSVALTFAVGRTVMYFIVSFGLTTILDVFGNYGILLISTPLLIGNYFGLNYFINLEKKNQAI